MPLCFDEIFLFFQDLKAKVQGMMLKYPWLTLLWNTICLKGFPDIGELRTIFLRKKRVNPAATKAA